MYLFGDLVRFDREVVFEVLTPRFEEAGLGLGRKEEYRQADGQ